MHLLTGFQRNFYYLQSLSFTSSAKHMWCGVVQPSEMHKHGPLILDSDLHPTLTTIAIAKRSLPTVVCFLSSVLSLSLFLSVSDENFGPALKPRKLAQSGESVSAFRTQCTLARYTEPEPSDDSARRRIGNFCAFFRQFAIWRTDPAVLMFVLFLSYLSVPQTG